MTYTDFDYCEAIADYMAAYLAANRRLSGPVERRGQFIHLDGDVAVRMKRLRELTANLRVRAEASR